MVYCNMIVNLSLSSRERRFCMGRNWI